MRCLYLLDSSSLKFRLVKNKAATPILQLTERASAAKTVLVEVKPLHTTMTTCEGVLKRFEASGASLISPPSLDAHVGEEEEDSGPIRMTRAELTKAALSNGGYSTPYLNDSLFLSFRGYRRIESLEAYTGLKALYGESNGFTVQSLEAGVRLQRLDPSVASK